MPNCKECGTTNMLVKVGEDEYLCFEHFETNRASESEMESLIIEYFDKNLEYLDVVYRKKMRKKK